MDYRECFTFKEVICVLLKEVDFPQEDKEGWYWIGGYDTEGEYKRVLVYLSSEVVQILRKEGADIVRAPTRKELLDWCLEDPEHRVSVVIDILGGGVYKVELPERGGD